MRSHVRVSLAALLVCVFVAVLAPGVADAAFGVEKFASLTCKENEPEGKPKECSATTKSQFFTQAGGHPSFGITDFTLDELGLAGNGVKSIRTDLPVGFSTNPRALEQCPLAIFEANLETAEANKCSASSIAGTQELTIITGFNVKSEPEFATLTGQVYNLVPKEGLPLEFGIDVNVGVHLHSFLEGFVSWHKEAEIEKEEGIATGDYHEYFKIGIAKSLSGGEAPLVRSRLIFNGRLASGKTENPGLLTNPSACPGPQTTHLFVESYTGAHATASYTTTATAAEENCGILKFEPLFLLTPSTTQQDKPDGITTELKMPINKESTENENSDLKTSVVTLPEGLTINPSAASGLEVCTPEEFAVGTEATAVSCPSRSVIGSAVDDVPGLPPESLKGNIYLGETKAGPITAPPYTIFVEAASKRYGQMVRLAGSVMPNLATGQLKTTFANTPQGPFEDVKLSFDAGSFANLANPLKCGAAVAEGVFSSYSGLTTLPQLPQFVVDSNGEKGACASPIPFALTQSSTPEPAIAGGSTAFTFSLERPDDQQYLKTVRTELPPGLLGIVPSVTQCPETQANAGTCPASSKIGTVVAKAGSGANPYPFSGSVYFTGPYEGAPYGLSIVVPVVAGPFEFKPEVTRSKITVNPSTAQVIVATTLPTINKEAGIPLRLRSLTVTVNRQGFERNPTNCEELKDNSVLTSAEGSEDSLLSGFQVEGCSGLAFKPTFTASTSGKPSKANGASLVTTITQPSGQANIKSVFVTLPKQLPSRLTTLQKACLAKVFEANPLNCAKESPGSEVGTATAVTPTLPGVMKGPAFLVSHGGEEFPALELVLEGDGVRVIVTGKTDIKKGITTTNFATTPDVPVSSVTVNLPLGPHSALAANGNLCAATLVMPTIITGQNGKQIKQNTPITPTGCGVQIVGHKVIGNTVYLTLKTFSAGRISGSGSGLSTTYRTLGAAHKTVTLKVPLSSAGRSRRRPFKVKVRVGFVPKKGAHSSATVTVSFR